MHWLILADLAFTRAEIRSIMFDVGMRRLSIRIEHAYSAADGWIDVDCRFADVVYLKSLADSAGILSQCSIESLSMVESLLEIDRHSADFHGRRQVKDMSFGRISDGHEIERPGGGDYNAYVLIADDLSMEWLCDAAEVTRSDG